MAWIGGSAKAIQIVWWVALGILVIGILIRDGYHGRSPGKRLLGLRLVTPRGEGCGYAGGIVSSGIDGLRIAEQICSELG